MIDTLISYFSYPFVRYALIAGVLIGILAKMPIIKIFAGVLGGIVELYVFVGVVISILVFLKILK